MSSSESDDDGGGTTDLTGFLFGNIDQHGRLENDLFDEESKGHLSQLNVLTGIGNFVKQFADSHPTDEAPQIPKISTLPDAVDYSNINELAEDDEETVSANIRTFQSGDDSISSGSEFAGSKFQSTFHPVHSGDATSQKQAEPKSGFGSGSDIILPSIVSHSAGQKTSIDSTRPEEKRDTKKVKKHRQDRKKRRKDRPAAQQQQLSEEEIAFEKQMEEIQTQVQNADIKSLFPEFRSGEVLRFLRLFGSVKPSSMPNRWRNCRKRKKKKRPDDIENESKTSKIESSVNDIIPINSVTLSIPDPSECLTDDEIKMMRPEKAKVRVESKKKSSENASDIPAWRYGPAALWYDMLGVPETGEGFDYGFKLKPKSSSENESTSSNKIPGPSAEHFYMVSQVKWEDDIIWNADDLINKVGSKSLQVSPEFDDKYKVRVNKAAHAGWVPTSTQRTALPSGSQPAKSPLAFPSTDNIKSDNSSPSKKKIFNSIFPIENYELIYGDWEKDIIWDDQNMDFIPEPKVFALNPNDENIILGIPKEPKPFGAPDEKENKKEKKSKLLLGKTAAKEEEEETKNVESKVDKWNLSNDEFYDPRKSSDNTLAVSMVGSLQHSIPALELQQPFFPTHMSAIKLHHFHRPPLRRYQKGPMSKAGFHVVQCLRKHIRQKAKQREQERAASGGGDVFFMRKPIDLSAMDGVLILAEYSEEYPLLLSQPGMATKMKNYYKRKPDKDSHCPRFRFGDTVFSHTSPFLGSLSPGQSLQAFENNMFRASVYEHKVPMTDFLVIRTRHGYFIRHVPYIFTIGQQCPLMEVPGPNSKKATNHVRDFLQVFIYRLFAKSVDNPKRIKMEEIRKAFPNHSESSIRKRLKLCADFNRTGPDSNWWVIRRDFRLPTEEEMRAMVATEHYCCHMSMLAAEQRLKDAGYGEKTLLVQPEDENGEDHQMKVDEEVLNAPWNTTRAYLSAIKGKCLLQVTGPADPTGCGEGFSYVKVPMKPQQTKDESAPAPPKKLVTGTDADLRRLSLSNAKNILRKYGVPDEEIRKLSRWEVIDVVRTMSTEQARAGANSKFARGTRFSVAEHQERYKEECQRVFDLQNRVLSSHDILSTDEDSSSGDDSDFEEMGKNIESILSNKKSTTQVSLEREEQERKELMKMISEGRSVDSTTPGRSSTPTQGIKKEKDIDTSSIGSIGPGKCLKIYRKFKSEDGSEFVRVETVRKPDVIDAYVRIRNSKDEEFIRKFIMMDEQHREEMRREKRRIQEQLRRIKRNQEKDKLNQEKRKEKGLKPNSKQDTLKTSQMKCGACGKLGHMRTNRYCPMYNRANAPPDRPVALTEEQEEDMEREMFADAQNLIKVEGTKITLSKNLLKSVEAVRRKSLVLKFQKPETPQPVQKRKRKYLGSATHCDYLTRPAKKKERKRADPVVTLSTLLEKILNGLRELPSTDPFHCPVNSRAVKDYYKIIEKPMDLQTMRDNLHKHSYLSRADFKEHLELIVNNSKIYNGLNSPLTKTAVQMTDYCESKFKELEDKLMRLEKAINPLLDDDDQVAFSFVLDNIITSKMMTIADSWPFHNPVNKKIVPDYYKVVDHPMDLGTLKKNVQKHMYQNRGQFMEHVELILINSSKFNGSDSKFTETARQIVEVCRTTLEEYDGDLTKLENDIAAAKKAAEEEAESGADDDVVAMDEASMDIGMDEDSNSSFAGMQLDDKSSSNIYEEVDVEKMENESNDLNTIQSTDFVSAAAAQIIGNQDENSNLTGGSEMQEGKSLLLEDLLMSDGEMSASEDDGGQSEEEEVNPFEGSESGNSDDETMKPSTSQQSSVNQEVAQDVVDENAMDVPASFQTSENSVTQQKTVTLSSEGEDSEAGSFVSVGGEVVSESELSET